MIYLDNAATTFPKPDIVLNTMNIYMREHGANPGRGGYEMAIAAGAVIQKTRDELALLINADDSMRISFTKNATEALNIGILGILRKGDHVVTTCMEHNSVLRPLHYLASNKIISVSYAKADKYGFVDSQTISKLIKRKTKMIICTFSSNVTGAVQPIREIGELASKSGIIFLVDGAQGIGSKPIDVKKMNIDILAFPGHKGLFGPQGTGGLYVTTGLEITPLMFGGTGSLSGQAKQPEFMPDIFESGTLNTPGIAGLGEGIKFIQKSEIINIEKYKNILTTRLYGGLNNIPGVKIFSPSDHKLNSGIISISMQNLDSAEVSNILDERFNIATRPGLHCAPLAHKNLGTFEIGLVRFSVSYLNSIEDIDSAIKAIEEISIMH